MAPPARRARSPRRPPPVAAPILALLVTAACGTRGSGLDGPAAVTDGLRISVENRNFYDATVYLLSGSVRSRLGAVQANASKAFHSEWLGAYVAVEIRLLSAGSYRSERIAVSPGDAVVIRVPPDLDRWRPVPRPWGSAAAPFLTHKLIIYKRL